MVRKVVLYYFLSTANKKKKLKLINMEAQEYLTEEWADKSISIIGFNSSQKILTGELVIQDYPNLEIISVVGQELTSLTIINCPNLKIINVRNNQLTKLEIQEKNQLTELIASQNQLTSLNLTNVQQITRLIVCDNPLLSEIKGLNLKNVKEINIGNSLVDLASEYEELKIEKEEAVKTIKTLKEAAEEKGWTLTQAVQNSIQAEEAIQSLLRKTEKDYRWWLDNPQEALPSFQLPESRSKIQKFLLDVFMVKVI